MQDGKALDALRGELAGLLANGLATEWRERAYTSEQVNEVVARLQGLAVDDYVSKLVVAGFTAEPYRGADADVHEACHTCMYYLTHQRYCELPELSLPVLPQWSCRLWRI